MISLKRQRLARTPHCQHNSRILARKHPVNSITGYRHREVQGRHLASVHRRQSHHLPRLVSCHRGYSRHKAQGLKFSVQAQQHTMRMRHNNRSKTLYRHPCSHPSLEDHRRSLHHRRQGRLRIDMLLLLDHNSNSLVRQHSALSHHRLKQINIRVNEVLPILMHLLLHHRLRLIRMHPDHHHSNSANLHLNNSDSPLVLRLVVLHKLQERLLVRYQGQRLLRHPQRPRSIVSDFQVIFFPYCTNFIIAKGDRSHISSHAQPIFQSLSAEFSRVEARAPSTYAPQVNDTRKRLEILFDHLNNEDLIKPDTIDQLLELSRAIEIRDWNRASEIQLDVQVNKVDECGNWMVGVKRLIGMGKATAG